MSEYDVYPSMDNLFNFPPSIRAAIAAYPELRDYYAPKVSPTLTTPTLSNAKFTGTPSGLTKAHVGLGSVDNTADVNKPVSNAVQNALNLKANLASPTFTGTVGGITKAMVGLANVDNTSDANKPVSSAVRTELDKGGLGIQSYTDMSIVTPNMTGLTVFLNIPTFTFLANVWYEIEIATSVAANTDGQQVLIQLYSASTSSGATATTGLTELTGYNAHPRANETWRVRANRIIKYASNTTLQIKATTSSTRPHFISSGPTYPTQLSIKHLGLT